MHFLSIFWFWCLFIWLKWCCQKAELFSSSFNDHHVQLLSVPNVGGCHWQHSWIWFIHPTTKTMTLQNHIFAFCCSFSISKMCRMNETCVFWNQLSMKRQCCKTWLKQATHTGSKCRCCQHCNLPNSCWQAVEEWGSHPNCMAISELEKRLRQWCCQSCSLSLICTKQHCKMKKITQPSQLHDQKWQSVHVWPQIFFEHIDSRQCNLWASSWC